MVARLFLVACLSAALAAGQAGVSLGRSGTVENDIARPFSEEETLRSVTEQAIEKVSETSRKIDNVTADITVITKNRADALLMLGLTQKFQLRKVVKEAVFKGMEKNKPLSSFQCISDRTAESLEKIDAVTDRIPTDTQKMLEKEVAKVKSFSLVMTEFGDYVEYTYRTKSEEIKKAGNDAIKKKILKEAVQKMTLLESILEEISKRAANIKNSLRNDLLTYEFNVGRTLRKIQNEGVDHINKCVA